MEKNPNIDRRRNLPLLCGHPLNLEDLWKKQSNPFGRLRIRNFTTLPGNTPNDWIKAVVRKDNVSLEVQSKSKFHPYGKVFVRAKIEDKEGRKTIALRVQGRYSDGRHHDGFYPGELTRNAVEFLLRHNNVQGIQFDWRPDSTNYLEYENAKNANLAKISKEELTPTALLSACSAAAKDTWTYKEIANPFDFCYVQFDSETEQELNSQQPLKISGTFLPTPTIHGNY